MVSFIGKGAGNATLAGIYHIGASQMLDYHGYCTFPGNRELEELGMAGRTPDMASCLAFDLERLDHHAEWIGRLVITWPLPYRQWWRWAKNGTFPVAAIEAESRFVRNMPDWHDLILTWHELQSLPASWCATLAQWRGI
ncbi:MAG: GIY-YIG nuclease family protein, partial [Betaproteobacteria bacterium]|nr:GIY-YIG nuclease family protein [Betaproteobacteria bacterium]